MKELSNDCQKGRHRECLRYYCDCSCHKPKMRVRVIPTKEGDKSEVSKRLQKIIDESKEPWKPPQIRTRFLKEKIKKARISRLKWNRIEDAMGTLSLSAPRYKSSDFRYIAELMHLESMLYSERQPDFGGGMGWGWGIGYLKEKYPKEYLAMLDELEPKGKHRERYAQRRQDESRAGKEWEERNKRDRRLFRRWWKESGGKI